MKKLLSIMLVILLCVSFSACSTNLPETNGSNSQENLSSYESSTSTTNTTSSTTPSSPSTQSSVSVPDPIPVDTTVTPMEAPVVSNPKIFLAGDSTVKTYDENQYIAGWGQYLQSFLNASDVTVVNKSNGGRSSRSFINEGRLYTNNDITTNFTSIESEISAGDYLLIQFGHNDDTTNGDPYSYYLDRKVPLGEPDANNIFPTVVPTMKNSTKYIPKDFMDNAQNAKVYTSVPLQYGNYYYSYDQGTFKGYLKMYIDFARNRGAIPILCTPVARVKFDSLGTTLIGGAGKHGPNFEYVLAVRQLAEEENCLLIDLFAETKTFLEAATKQEANYLMALKPNSLTGEWPTGYDLAYGNTSLGYNGIEATHYNKYGAYITAAKVAEAFIELNANNTTGLSYEKINFSSSVLTTPTQYVMPSTLMSLQTVTSINALFSKVSISASN